ncbi:MAG: type II toxin-antitoxin system VapC family toxin [Pseudomonadota bacterium]
MTAVFDASAILAIIRSERGSEVALASARGGVVSSVNIVEVLQRLAEIGVEPDRALEQLVRLGIEIVPLSLEQAVIAAALRAPTKHKGVSLGDRSCLALGQHLGLPVITADTKWEGLDLGIEIRQIR